MKKAYLASFGFYLILLGLFIYPHIQRQISRLQQAPSPTPVETIQTVGKPNRIVLPNQTIDLEIIDGEFTQTNWSQNPTKAVFATLTELPNNKRGNTLIYGHNTPRVFYATDRLTEGDIAQVYTDKGVFNYTFSGSELVNPSDLSVFDYQGEPRLTLLTCHGIFNSQRRLMYFKFRDIHQL